MLNNLKINDLLVMAGNNADEKLIGIVTKVSKKRVDVNEDENDDNIELVYSYNYCTVTLVGTFYNREGVSHQHVFKRAVNTYPEINSDVYLADGDCLSIIMNSLDSGTENSQKLVIGKYASNKSVAAILDGNRFSNVMHVL